MATNLWCEQCGNGGHLAEECDRVYLPGDRVLVFDSLLYKDDKATPLSTTLKWGTVIKWYGTPMREYPINDLVLGPYESVVDVEFDHRKGISSGHFTYGIPVHYHP